MSTKSGFNFQNSYEKLPSFYYTQTDLSIVSDPNIVQFNRSLAKDLGLQVEFLKSGEGAQILAGNKLPENSSSLAQAYAGHQFGQFTMLGDGRALLLGEHKTQDGQMFDVQLKGSGPTRYSRSGDGRAGIGPMLREYLISEAMHGLGIPTTRGLAVTTTGESVIRERLLRGAILTRVATSHLRVGTFQYGLAWGSIEQLKKLADYSIERHDPDILSSEEPYLEFLLRVIDRQSKLIAQWQLVGFIHGVMNTDNMTISGETIDYGPCAFLDHFDPKTVFSSIDDHGRYAFGNQPYIGKWNLTRFAETLIPLLHDDQEQAVKIAEEALATYDKKFTKYYLTGMLRKLGLFDEQTDDKDLVHDLLGLLEKYKVDYTNFFVKLIADLSVGDDATNNQSTSGQTDDSVAKLFQETNDDFNDWLEQWQKRLHSQKQTKKEAKQLMKANNPKIIPRNYHVEEALKQVVENNDYTLFNEFSTALTNPYSHDDKQNKFAIVPEPNMPYRTFCGT